DDLPQLRALKTRIASVHYQPTNEEIAALMRKIASDGHRHGAQWLMPEHCLEVAQAIIERSQSSRRNLDIRLLINAFQDRLQGAAGVSETHWLDLLESRMKGEVVATAGGCGVRAERKNRELELVRRIANLPRQERLEIWRKETGKSEPALYRRLEE